MTPTIVITDPAMLQVLAAATGVVHLRDAAGHLVGEVLKPPEGVLPPGVKSPFSDAEIDRRRNLPPAGRPLADIWKRLDGGGR